MVHQIHSSGSLPDSQGVLSSLSKQIPWTTIAGKDVEIMKQPESTAEQLEFAKSTQSRKEGMPSVDHPLTNEIQAIERLYAFRGKTEVLRFLETYPFLASLLLEAYGRIKNYFSDAQIFLKVVADPEAIDDDLDNNTEMDDYEELVAFIATHLAPQEAVEKLKQLYQEWWLKTANLSKGKLGINLECL
jgi:hypothetical protein